MTRIPFSGVDRRTILVRATLLTATLLGMLASFPLWINSREFPVLPISSGFPVLASPWDHLLRGAMLLSLVLACWWYRHAVGFFLLASLFSYFEDQNRGQPWFYMYWVMLLLSLAPTPTAIAACRCAVSVAYIWSGIQKMTPAFFSGVPAWFVAPAADWHLPTWAIDALRWGVTTAPFVELGIGLALWFPQVRRVAIISAVIVHGVSLIFLGPLGRNYNWIVWPWNLAMIGLVWSLFAGVERNPSDWPPRVRKTSSNLGRSRWVSVVLALYTFLPGLSYFGMWDSDFSFTLYAETQANANIFVTQAFADRLPPKLRAYVKPYPNFDPQFQGPNMFLYGAWCDAELHVPVVPEPRNYRAIFRYLRQYSKEPSDLRLIVAPRTGPVICYQGDAFVLLGRK